MFVVFLGLAKHKIFWRQFTKFAIVGVFNTVIDWSLFYVLTSFTGLNSLIANVISYTVAMIYNFFASTRCVLSFELRSKKRSGACLLSLRLKMLADF